MLDWMLIAAGTTSVLVFAEGILLPSTDLAFQERGLMEGKGGTGGPAGREVPAGTGKFTGDSLRSLGGNGLVGARPRWTVLDQTDFIAGLLYCSRPPAPGPAGSQSPFPNSQASRTIMWPMGSSEWAA